MRRLIVIGTRGSQLALWQAKNLQEQLIELNSITELKIIKTQGDKIQNLSFDKMEGKGFFTKEIEDSLLNKKIDVAVHSLKDLPTESPQGLVIAGLSKREDPSDVLIIRKDSIDNSQTLKLKKGAVIGTSSVRRRAQIKDLLDHIIIKDLRGNVPTRISKLDSGEYDGIILAKAGVNRLSSDLAAYEVLRLHPREFIPAPGQGIIAYQCRENDNEMRRILNKIHHREVSELSNVERKVLQLIGGGCHIPLGVFCEKDPSNNYHVSAAYQQGEKMKRIIVSQSTTFQLAEKVVQELLN